VRRRAILTAALLLGNAEGTGFDPVAADDAIAYFRHICVDTMPEPRAFAAAFNADTSGWTRHQKGDRRTRVLGRFWRSSRGELAYVHLPGVHLLEWNPACHYAFRTAAGFSHDDAQRSLARALNLGPGQATGSRREPQTRWEATLPTGLRVRLVLSTAVRDMGGPAATLSISAYRGARRTP
jgi:hypothetical protein